MKMQITLIRSGRTNDNREGKYIGHTDPDLDQDSIQELLRRKEEEVYPQVSRVYTSEQLRSRNTASLLYPHLPAIVVGELRAFGFGAYEGKRYHEIVQDPAFVDWANSEEVLSYAGGEDPNGFIARCTKAFFTITREMEVNRIHSAAVVTHNSVIFTLLQRYCAPRSRYLVQHFGYGGGCTIDYDSKLCAGKLQNTF